MRVVVIALSALLLSSGAYAVLQPSLQMPGGAGNISMNPGALNPNALNSGTLPVNWQQSNINWDQLENLFTQNPAFQRFNIHFPDGFNWNVNEATLMQFHATYASQLAAKGLSGRKLSFSPHARRASVSGDSVTLPVNMAFDNVEQTASNLMDQITYERYHLAEFLPDWVKKIISTICIGFGVLYDFAVDEIHKLF